MAAALIQSPEDSTTHNIRDTGPNEMTLAAGSTSPTERKEKIKSLIYLTPRGFATTQINRSDFDTLLSTYLSYIFLFTA